MLVANYFPNLRQAPQALPLAAQEVDPGLGQVARLTVYVDGNYGGTGQIATPDQNSAAIKILQRLAGAEGTSIIFAPQSQLWLMILTNDVHNKQCRGFSEKIGGIKIATCRRKPCTIWR